MSKQIDFNVYVHIRGSVEAESDSEADLLDAIFPDGWEGEVLGVSTDAQFLPSGYIRVTEIQEDDDSDSEEDDEREDNDDGWDE